MIDHQTIKLSCRHHGKQKQDEWACPSCLREMRNEIAMLKIALEKWQSIHTESAGFSGKYGRALDAAIAEQQKKVDAACQATAEALKQPATAAMHIGTLEILPARNFRRQQNRNGSYRMVEAYTEQELLAHVAEAVSREREECAKICDGQQPVSEEECPEHWEAYRQSWSVRKFTANQCAHLIRSRAPR